MTYATYPSSLPLPLQQGYSQTISPNITRTSLKGGKSYQRLVTSNANSQVNCSFLFVGGQYKTFRDFLATINEGADWFLMPLLKIDGSNGTENRLVRIVSGKLTANLNCNNGTQIWTVNCQLDVDEVYSGS